MQKDEIQRTIDNTKEFNRVMLEEHVTNNTHMHKNKARIYDAKMTQFGDKVNKEMDAYCDKLFSEAETKIEAYKVDHNEEEIKLYENSIYEKIDKKIGAYANKLHKKTHRQMRKEKTEIDRDSIAIPMSIGAVFSIFIALGVFGVFEPVENVVFDSKQTEEQEMFPNEFGDPYKIVDNKLYYNINCNGNLEAQFITDVDEENDELSIAGDVKNFPVVMINGEPKAFVLENVINTDKRYFYTVEEILIKELSINELEFFLTNAESVWQLGDDLKQQNQYIQTEMQCLNTGAIVVKEKINVDLKPQEQYEVRVFEKTYKVDGSWQEVHQQAKDCIFGK